MSVLNAEKKSALKCLLPKVLVNSPSPCQETKQIALVISAVVQVEVERYLKQNTAW